MIKKSVLSSTFAAVLFFVSAPAMADEYGMAGCGLGSMVITGSNGFEQIFVAYTNSSSGSQTSGITSGTSNCRDGAKKTANLFYEINKEALKRDVARGEGETIVSLAEILGCNDSAPLAVSLQKNFAQVFNTNETAPVFMDKVEPLIEANSALQCQAI